MGLAWTVPGMGDDPSGAGTNPAGGAAQGVTYLAQQGVVVSTEVLGQQSTERAQEQAAAQGKAVSKSDVHFANEQAQKAATMQIGTGALTGAATGAAAGTMIFPGIGTAIGAVVGAIAGAVAGIVSFTNAKGTSHGERMLEFNSAIQGLQGNASLAQITPDLQAAAQQLQAYQDLIAQAGSLSSSAVTTGAANANYALAQVGDQVVADVNAYMAGKSAINPWNATPAGDALARLPQEHQDLIAATSQAAQANVALAMALGQAVPS